MLRRFPQAVRVGDLVGLPLLDERDVTIGRIAQVVSDAAGNILLIVPYGDWTAWRKRPVAVPVEVVAMLGRQVAAIDMPRAEFDAAPDWTGKPAAVLGPDDIVRVALGRR
jgi:ribosomal 30S subunit maturation factor RimM